MTDTAQDARLRELLLEARRQLVNVELIVADRPIDALIVRRFARAFESYAVAIETAYRASQAQVVELRQKARDANARANAAVRDRNDMGRLREAATARADRMAAALRNAETVMSIVAPRSDTAEYLAALEQIRAALAGDKSSGVET